MKASAIIPTYRLDDHRKRNLKRLKKYLESQTIDVEILVIEQDYERKPVFNKCWLMNQGVRQTTTDNLFICDVDVSGDDPDHFRKFIKWCWDKDYCWAFPWNRLLYYKEDGNSLERDDYPEPGIQEGGIVYFHKSLWEEMGGANEFIWQLRGPDNDIALRARYLTASHNGFDCTLRHNWHPHSPMKIGGHRKRNKDILKYTRKCPWAVIKMLKQLDWGNLNESYAERESFFEARMRFGV